jgi:hypothetical protein
MHRTTLRLFALLSILSVAGLVSPAEVHASDACATPHCGPFAEDPGDGCLGSDDPFCDGGCQPESIFDRSCGGGADHCTDDCTDCAQTTAGWVCATVSWSAHCSCWLQQETDGNSTCNTRGSCSVVL